MKVYPNDATEFRGATGVGNLVRVVGISTLGLGFPGPIVGERIRHRPGGGAAGPAACELSFVATGRVRNDGGDFLTITIDFLTDEVSDFVIVDGLTELEVPDGLTELLPVVVSFSVLGTPLLCQT